MAKVIVLAGMSGAGRTVAAGALSDRGWFVIDNLPAELVSKIGNLAASAGGDYEKIGMVVSGYTDEMSEQIDLLRSEIQDFKLIFLEASKDVLISRYKTTKRRHPYNEVNLSTAINKETEDLKEAREDSDLIIDTSELNPYQLRERIFAIVDKGNEESQENLNVMLLSFGFKNGLPRDVDLIFDCRFMPNPHWVPELRKSTGQESSIQEYVMEPEISKKFLNQLEEMLITLLPHYVKEGKSYLTIALGCTGGKHRSVSVAEILGKRLENAGWENIVRHRDIEKT